MNKENEFNINVEKIKEGAAFKTPREFPRMTVLTDGLYSGETMVTIKSEMAYGETNYIHCGLAEK